MSRLPPESHSSSGDVISLNTGPFISLWFPLQTSNIGEFCDNYFEKKMVKYNSTAWDDKSPYISMLAL